MRRHRRPSSTRPLLAAFALAVGVSLSAARPAPSAEVGAGSGARSAAAFAEVARVLRHPRCLNCHPSGDRPHVGDDGRVHAMLVQRGEGGHGRPGQRCSACHRDENQELARVPGAPRWHLAPRSMGWVGLDDHDLAEALKDPARNGGLSLAELREHMAHDPLVLWGWEPGVGRKPVPISHAAFLRHLDAWIEGGAASPEPGMTSTY